ncbi:16457_t:CDS:2 [Dentiscutata erythropus]|uniref:16457_t:CDS:1 n=1 Tax=Dentiscutata erythropus TaxID=1348616 RepID=A0A9N9CWJ9_9GLOM|nr:16457_t:CDS:2 [Dentiscutata erythropus]
MIDTGFGDFLIPSTNCTDSFDNKTRYNPGNGSSFSTRNDFGLVNKFSDIYRINEFDGILGLAKYNEFIKEHQTSFYEVLVVILKIKDSH